MKCEFEDCLATATYHIRQGDHERHFCERHAQETLTSEIGGEMMPRHVSPDFDHPIRISSLAQIGDFTSRDEGDFEIFKAYHAIKCQAKDGKVAFLFSDEAYWENEPDKLFFVASGWNPEVVLVAPQQLFDTVAKVKFG